MTSPLPLRSRVQVALVSSSLMFLVYWLINRYPTGTQVLTAMPEWIPFRPVYTLPYLSMMTFAVVGTICLRTPAAFRSALFGVGVGFGCCAAIWLVYPTTLPRPAVSLDGWTLPYRLMIEIDPPNNVFPAAHAVSPLIVGWHLSKEYPAWRWPVVGYLLATLPTICLVGQHRPADVLAGLLFGVVGLVAGEKLSLKA
jgi:hypothetical protein